MRPIGVLCVDDSAFARRVFRGVLGSEPDIAVLGVARDGLEALEEIPRLSPDVITLDLMMPNLDGVRLLEQLSPALRRRVVVVSISDRDSEPGVRALQLGAFDIVTKPTALATDALHEIGEELVGAVRRCAMAAAERAHRPARTAAPPPLRLSHARDIVVIGASTGGPAALTRVVPALPPDLRAPVVVALHIPAGYTSAFARRLDDASRVRVREALDGDRLVAGTVLIAPGGKNLSLERRGAHVYCRVRPPPADAPFAPSVDLLFESAARAVGRGLLAAVLTGMGDDGLVGAHAVVERGGIVVTESWSSAVVYGMPRMVDEAGLSAASVSIERIPETILRLTRAAQRPSGEERRL